MNDIDAKLEKELNRIDDIRCALRSPFECGIKGLNLCLTSVQNQIMGSVFYTMSLKFREIEKRLEALENEK